MPKKSEKNKKSKRFQFGAGAQNKGGQGGRQPNNRNGLWTWILFGVAVIVLLSLYSGPDMAGTKIDFSEFRKRVESGEIKRVVLSDKLYKGYKKTKSETKVKSGTRPMVGARGQYYVTIPVLSDSSFITLLTEKGVEYEAEDVELRNLFWHWILPFIVLILVWRFLFSRAFKMGPGAGLMSFGKNRAKLVADDTKKVTFNEVAGVDEAKEELTEIIEFLKSPEKFRELGGKIPKGILLVGPPGTGKTLLARAVAGEAKVPFFSLSGSEFVEMFVGVGAARVRDLFAQAVEKSPCIIFIDELDAIGKVRSAVSPMGGHDEREQTLNQLLIEMDGFDTRTGVIIMAATNRPETLDPALLRAGRFDRQVLVDRPDINGREAILRLHSKALKLAEKVDLRVVAARTPGFAGADLANVANEAALLAVRKGKTKVDQSDFEDAIDRVLAGLQKKTRLINEKEKEIVSHHETGHALVTCFTPDADPVHKVSVIPRGFGALGFTLNLPKEDRYLMTRNELLARIDILYGGRVAEEVMFNEISTGASDDLQKATDIARAMVMEYGMSDKVGQRAYSGEKAKFIQSPAGPVASKEYSDATSERIDSEIDRILSESYARVKKLVTKKKALLSYIARVLSEKEVIEGDELKQLIKDFESGKTIAPKKTEKEPSVSAPPPEGATDKKGPSEPLISP